MGLYMKNMGKKTKFRLFLLGIMLMLSSGVLLYSIFTNASKSFKIQKEIEELEISYSKSLEEEENLKEEINKLNDPEYMARYTREKYLYSKDNEIIIKIED